MRDRLVVINSKLISLKFLLTPKAQNQRVEIKFQVENFTDLDGAGESFQETIYIDLRNSNQKNIRNSSVFHSILANEVLNNGDLERKIAAAPPAGA